MKFIRQLKQGFIKELNRLHADEKSWWHKMVEDDEAFILIRENRIHVLVNGGLLLQVKMDAHGSLKCQVHEDFLSLRSQKNRYIQLTENEPPQIERVKGLKGLAEHYEQIKRRIKLFSEKEKKVVQDIGANNKQIVDLEVGLEGELKPEAARKGAQRVDMAAVSNEGVLVFFEVKLFDNSEIRSEAIPPVVNQMKKYESLLKKYRNDILAGYKDQFDMYAILEGRFFKRRRQVLERFDVYSKARLIITGFDSSQQKVHLPKIVESINKGMEWEEKNNDLIIVGNHQNIKMEVLLKGIS